MKAVSQSEIDEFVGSVVSRLECLDTSYVVELYRSYGLNVFPDPYCGDLPAIIKSALKNELPFSVVRIGDGEANLLTYGVSASTKELNRCAVKAIVEMQSDSFLVSDQWMIVLRDLMMGAIAQADIVGVLGCWQVPRRHPAPKYPTAEEVADAFLKDRRGISGYWRGIEYMLYLASKKWLDNKVIASAHLYLSILEHLDELLPQAKAIVILSSRKAVQDKLSRRYPRLDFQYIEVGTTKSPSGILPDQPIFLESIFSALPQDMRGCLCLIGAGPWAEIYCTWVKHRGGVGIDIGSGFDLLDGVMTRPIHKEIGMKELAKYQL